MKICILIPDTAFLRLSPPTAPYSLTVTTHSVQMRKCLFLGEHAQGAAVLNTAYRVRDYLMRGPVAMLATYT